MGLMRSLRGYLPSTFDVRMNVICPWPTDTEMLDGVRDLWVQNALPMNTPDDVARLVLQCAGDETLHGKAVYVADGKGFDIEEGINRLEPEWMGQNQASDLARGQEIVGTVSSHTLSGERQSVSDKVSLRDLHGRPKTELNRLTRFDYYEGFFMAG